MKWIQRRLRNLLGLEDDLEEALRKIDDLVESYIEQKLALNQYIATARVNQAGIGRIIAKWDEKWAQSELPPVRPGTDPKADKAWEDRKAESDRIGEEVIRRLRAEDWARRHSEGHPDAPPK